jgi:hypothetical protein
MQGLLVAGSMAGDTHIALKVQLHMGKQPMLLRQAFKGELPGGGSVSSSVASQATSVEHGNYFRNIRHAA